MAATITLDGPQLSNSYIVTYTVTLPRAQTGASADWFKILPDSDLGVTPTVVSVSALDAGNTQYRVSVSTAGFDGTFHLNLDIPSFDSGHRTTLDPQTPGNFLADYVLGDLNGDGRPDLVTSDYHDLFGESGKQYLNVFMNNGDGTFPDQPSLKYTDDGWVPMGLSLADFNRDGLLDVAIANSSDEEVWIRLNAGDGTLQHQTSRTTPDVGSFPTEVLVADFDGDGITDIVAENINDLSILLGKGNGQFRDQSTVKLTKGLGNDGDGEVGTGVMTLGDINGDGLTDILVEQFSLINGQSFGYTLLLGKGNPDHDNDADFTRKFIDITGTSFLEQLGGEGVSDLITLNNHAVAIRSWTGDGFGDPVQIALTRNPYNLAVADVNQDGIPDIITANTDGTVSILPGQGGTSFAPEQVVRSLGDNFRVKTADLDGDGRTDLILEDQSGQLNFAYNQHQFAAGPSATIDHTPPFIVITSAAGPSDQYTQTISGIVAGSSAGAFVSLYESGSYLGSAPIDDFGRWSTTITFTITGPHVIVAQAPDNVGNVGTSSAVTYIIDLDVGSPLIDRAGTTKSGPGDDVLAGTPSAQTFFFDTRAGSTGKDTIDHLGSDDVIVLTTKLPDFNQDGIVTFGANRTLDIDGFDARKDQIVVGGVVPGKGLRYLGESGDGYFAYAAAEVRPRSAKEGRISHDDTLSGGIVDNKRDLFFVDTALHTDLGQDRILNFGAHDFLVTTSKFADPDDDGRVAFGPTGLALDDGGSLRILNPAGTALDTLSLAGTTMHGDVTYYLYGTQNATNTSLTLDYL